MEVRGASPAGVASGLDKALITIRLKGHASGFAACYFNRSSKCGGANTRKHASLVHAIKRSAYRAIILLGD